MMSACSSEGLKEYKKLNGLKLRQAVFERTTFQNDSISYDTLSVAVTKNSFLFTYVNDFNEGAKMKLFELYEPYQISSEGDTILRVTSINYDLLGDTIRYFSKEEWTIGETRIYEKDGKKIKILRQPSWVWTKSRQPNVMDYYSEDFGLILTLSRTRKLRLKRFIGKENMESFAWLIEATENDSKFFNQMKSSMLASG